MRKNVNTDAVARSLALSGRKKKNKERLGYALRVLMGICFISPLAIGILFSFVPNEYLNSLPSFDTILQNFTLENYQHLFSSIPVLRYVGNSLTLCLIIISVQIIVSCLAAYAFSCFDFPGKDFFFNLILIAMMIPGQVTTITNYLTVQGMGLINTYIGLCLPYFVGGTAIFMMRQFFLTLPRELKEASLLDGCSDMRFLFKIAIPLAVPTIASLAIYIFIDIYNLYFWPMLVAQDPNMFTVQIGMSMLVSSGAVEYGRVLAGAVISILIPLIAFIIGESYLIKGMTAGAVKG
ncbi:MAG: carbohydrate ABC transporter permease [Oscillospiraceae bacterium]|nr:carbohydrate ABC transporter permease [Oscillospiraceae bacterium]